MKERVPATADRQATGQPQKVAILGFGTVGSSLARILCELALPEVKLSSIFNRGIDRKRVSWVASSVLWTESFDEILASAPDLLVEVAGGLEPAGDWVRRALAAGKSVVTANKKLIAQQGPALEELARRHGCQLRYGAAVAGGVPVIPGVQQGLAGDRIHKLRGILNGTCNFILSNMEAGSSFESALKQAQELGYAEADPTEDVDGYDARAKLVILARIGMRLEVLQEEIVCTTIRALSAIDFAYAKDLGATIRQIARAEVRDQALLASVGPMLVPRNSPLAWSRGTENMVISSGKYGGDIVFSGYGAGGNPTAVAVLSDMLDIAHGGSPVAIASSQAKVDGEFVVPHYIRFVVDDRPGIVAQIAGFLAEQSININAILQKPGHAKLSLPFVVTVEACRGSALKKALAKIARLDSMREPPLDLQMLEAEGSAP
jgi:homoserine dehydrogenase